MKTRFEYLPKDIIREIIKHLNLDAAQKAAQAYPIVNDAVQFVWRDRTRRHFPEHFASMTENEKSAVTNWPQEYYQLIVHDVLRFPENLTRALYDMKEGDFRAVLQANLEISYLLKREHTGRESLISLANKVNNQMVLNHFYHIAKEFFKNPENPATILPDKQDFHGHTLLHWAVLTNQSTAVIRELVDLGCDINCRMHHITDDTPLMIAVKKRRAELVMTLLQLGAKTTDRSDNHPNTPLCLAVDLLFPDIVHTLLARAPSTNRCVIIPDEKDQPLTCAVEAGYLDVVKVILEDTKNPDLIDNLKRRTPLHLAARHGKIEIVNYLLSMGAAVDAVDQYGMTPLHLAIKHGHDEITLALLAHQADVNKKMNNGYSPIFLSVLNGRELTFKTLLQHGADLAAAKDNVLEQTTLYAAVLRNHNHMIPILLEHGVDINEKSMDDRTALFLAVKSNRLEDVKYLLSKCANPDIPNAYGKTPLHVAASNGNVDMVKLLMRYHANPNKLTYGRLRSPEDIAIGAGHTVIAKLLASYTKSAHTNRLFGWYQHQTQETARHPEERFLRRRIS